MTQALSLSTCNFSGHPGLVLRRGEDRFHSQHGWLESWHSFSFAGHNDPKWRGFGSLLVINDDTVQAGSGFGWHAHRDMEIISVILDGELTHRDSMGHTQTLTATEVQTLSAGSGIIHSEFNHGSRPCRFLQIWIQPDSTGIHPMYHQRRYAFDDAWTLLIDPARAEGALSIHRSVRLWRARPSQARSLPVPIAPGSRGWLQMVDGAVDVEFQVEPAGAMARLVQGDGLGFPAGLVRSITSADSTADLLLFELH
jgi:redox-sensitive bicupin YhaK (pirin superfamily)